MKNFNDVPLEYYKDFPEVGVNFIDVGCVFDTPKHWHLALGDLESKLRGLDFDFILAMDARGFMIAGALATDFNIGFAMARKPGKLPGDSISKEYKREYGSACIEIQPERIKGQRILIVDDVIATGGTIEAAAFLLRSIGKEPVAAAALFDIQYFQNKRTLSIPIITLKEI
jgi:adenine phosphoribosyltransferase